MLKKAYHHGNLEIELIETGLKLLHEKGIDGLSLRKIASACGVSHSAPYKHFKDLEDLLNAMQDYVSNNFAEALAESLIVNKDSDNRMIYFAKSYLEFFMSNPHYFYFFIKQDHNIIDLTNLKEKSSHKPFEVFRFAVWEEFEEYKIPEEKRCSMLIKMWGLVHGITLMAIMQNIKFDRDWKELLGDILAKNDYKEFE